MTPDKEKLTNSDKSGSDKILTKSVKFNGKELKLYSLDGNTWSSRKEELSTIKERFENTRLSMTLDGAKQGKRLFGKAKRAPMAKVAGAGDAGFADVELDADFPEELIPEDVAIDDAVFEDIVDDGIASVKGAKSAKGAKESKIKTVTPKEAKKNNLSKSDSSKKSRSAKSKTLEKPKKTLSKTKEVAIAKKTSKKETEKVTKAKKPANTKKTPQVKKKK